MTCTTMVEEKFCLELVCSICSNGALAVLNSSAVFF